MPSVIDNAIAYQLGEKAHNARMPIYGNPYSKNDTPAYETNEHTAWRHGWNDAQKASAARDARLHNLPE